MVVLCFIVLRGYFCDPCLPESKHICMKTDVSVLINRLVNSIHHLTGDNSFFACVLVRATLL